MSEVSSERGGTWSAKPDGGIAVTARPSRAPRAIVIALAVQMTAAAVGGCAEVLGIPSDPVLVEPDPVWPLDAGAAGAAGEPTAPVAPVTGASGDGLGADGVLPPDDTIGIDAQGGRALDAGTPDGGAPDPLAGGGVPPAASDAGLAVDAAAPAPTCEATSSAMDLVFIVDNSGSMAAETAAFESALGDFAVRLEQAGADQRTILISRHRQDERSASEEASTSLCIAAPVSGLEACPGPRPVASARFFQYSIKIDSSDSLQRVLASFEEPDPFGLTTRGWSEWLRPEAQTIFIEISDADSDLPAADFSSAFEAARERLLGAPRRGPPFVFHSVIGVAQKPDEPDVYGADEPSVSEVCRSDDGTPENAGSVYQDLSRSTGGSRQSICPPSAMGSRLSRLAEDVIARSLQACPEPD